MSKKLVCCFYKSIDSTEISYSADNLGNMQINLGNPLNCQKVFDFSYHLGYLHITF